MPFLVQAVSAKAIVEATAHFGSPPFSAWAFRAMSLREVLVDISVAGISMSMTKLLSHNAAELALRARLRGRCRRHLNTTDIFRGASRNLQALSRRCETLVCRSARAQFHCAPKPHVGGNVRCFHGGTPTLQQRPASQARPLAVRPRSPQKGGAAAERRRVLWHACEAHRG